MNLPKISLSIITCLLGLGVYAQPSSVMLTGFVSDSAGNRLCGAIVSVEKISVGMLSGKDGIYSLSLRPGQYVISVSLKGFEPVSELVTLPAEDFIQENFVLFPGEQGAVPFTPGKCLSHRSLYTPLFVWARR